MRARQLLLQTALPVMLAAAPVLAVPTAAPLGTVTEREKFDADRTAKARDQALAERAQSAAEADLALRRDTANASRWLNPLVLAVLAAAIAAAGNAVVTLLNGRQQRALEADRANASRGLEQNKIEAQISLEREKAAAQRALDEQQSESDRILEVIKTGGDTEAAARNMQFLVDAGLVTKDALVAKLTAYLEKRVPGGGPSLPAGDGQFSFKRDDMLTSETEADMSANLTQFLGYLGKVGFPRAAAEVKIEVQGDLANAYYLPERHTVVLGLPFRDDPDVARREYMHHLLNQLSGGFREEFGYIAVESGLADYFPCSYAGKPLLAEIAARNLKLETPSVRSLRQTTRYGDLKPDDDSMFVGGQAWGSLFWDMREALGQAVTDRLLLTAWQGVEWPRPARRKRSQSENDHAQALIETAARTFTGAMLAAADPVRDKVRNLIAARGYPLPA
jgi:hypothetical protein